MPKESDADNVGYLIVWLALAAFIICALVAGYLNTLVPTSTHSIQDAVLVVLRQMFFAYTAAAALFVALYVILARRRLTPRQIREDIRTQFQTTELSYLKEVAHRFPSAKSPEFRQVHYGSFNSLPLWTEEIEQCRESIEIVAYYFDSWITEQAQRLRMAAERGVKLTMIVADPDVPANIVAARAVFPHLSEEQIKQKIENTASRFKNVGFTSKNLSILYLPHPLTYSAQYFDKKKLLISLFEYGRKMEISSPVLEFDLRQSSSLASFWSKEIGALTEVESSRI